MSKETLPAAVGARLEPGVRRLAPERDVLAELRDAAARKWLGNPATQRADLFARAACEITALRAALDPLLSQVLAIAQSDGRMCVATVQRKMAVSYSTARTLCQIVEDRGETAGLEISPLLARSEPANVVLRGARSEDGEAS